MLILRRSFFALIAWSISLLAHAQLEKVELALEDGNYRKMVKLTESYMEDQQLKKMPEIYFYYAKAQLELSKDPIYFEKNPDIMKDGVKAALKGRKRDKDSTVTPNFLDLMDEISLRQNELAYDMYKINKMSKAGKMYDLSFELNGNRKAYLMSAKCAIDMRDSVKSDTIFAQLIQWYANDKDNEVEDAEIEIDPYVYYINKCWNYRKFDSAHYYIDEARRVVGNTDKVNYYDKEVLLDEIKDMPPSNTLLNMVQEVLAYMPADKELLHKENALYIYLIKHYMTHDMTVTADEMISKFIGEKVTRAGSREAGAIKATDVFVEAKPENVVWKLAEYFQTYQHLVTAEHVLVKYIHMTAKDTTDEAVAERWNTISRFAYSTKGLPYAVFILENAIERYPTEEQLLDLRKKIIAEKEVVKTTADEQGALYSLMKAEYETDASVDNRERLLQINDKYVGLLIGANRFSTVKEVMQEQMNFAPEKDYSERLKFIAKEDFYHNYFMTKTKGKNPDGEEVELFKWNGNVSNCDPGEIDMDIQEKVANRINYFRRNAGVPEVFFDQATNEYCQKAALMMTVNRKLDHEPTKSWRCFTDDGAYAARHSLLIQDANTSMAVTYIMDDKNPSAGNRRWLLYPNGKIYGHGSTDNVAVIWALDDSGTTDSAMFRTNPMTWPPKGYVPQMMLFTNWTFSLYQDLDSATVEVTQDGSPLKVKLENYVEGYGAPTLVFKPEYDKAALPDNSDFEVTVTLSDGSKYSYTVHTFSYDPNRL